MKTDIPIRIQKFLAERGVASRRTLEQWIVAKRLHINGIIATLGMKVLPTDLIMLDNKPLKFNTLTSLKTNTQVLLYNKPEGVICTRYDKENRPNIFAHLPKVSGQRWIAVGRLDLNTSGLLLLTTNGLLAHRLLHPSYQIEREYAVRVLGSLSLIQKKQMLSGIMLDDGLAKFKSIKTTTSSGLNHWYHVVITEGRKREVRRLFQSQNLIVNRLIRTRFAHLYLPTTLRKGNYIELTSKEISCLFNIVSLKASIQ